MLADVMIDQITFAKELGRRIAEHRKIEGLSQAQLAKLVECSQQMIGDYETGRRRIPACKLASIADALSISTAELLDGAVHPQTKRGPSSRIEQLATRVAKLPRARQKFVTAMIENALQVQ